MKGFGFTISQPRSININDDVDDTFLRLEKRVPSIKRCFNCGGCTATCSSGQFTQFNIRKIHNMFRWGEYKGIAEELQKCMLCGKCTLVCPRGVNLRDLVINMRKILSKLPSNV